MPKCGRRPRGARLDEILRRWSRPAPNAAGWHDVWSALTNRSPSGKVILFPLMVRGKSGGPPYEASSASVNSGARSRRYLALSLFPVMVAVGVMALLKPLAIMTGLPGELATASWIVSARLCIQTAVSGTDAR